MGILKQAEGGVPVSMLGRPDAAAEAYRATLAQSPNRARSLAALE